jgi:hypothetical protein
MTAKTPLESLVTILKPREKRVKLKTPSFIEGRQFTEEMATVYEPYHRKQRAHVDGMTVTMREIRDVDTSMRLSVGDQQLAITDIRTLAADHTDKEKMKFTELTCRPVEGE